MQLGGCVCGCYEAAGCVPSPRWGQPHVSCSPFPTQLCEQFAPPPRFPMLLSRPSPHPHPTTPQGTTRSLNAARMHLSPAVSRLQASITAGHVAEPDVRASLASLQALLADVEARLARGDSASAPPAAPAPAPAAP